MIPKILIWLLATVLLITASIAEAQQPKKVYRIGFLRRPAPIPAALEAFRKGLSDLGYIEEKNIIIEQRYANDIADRLPDLAAELVQLKVDVIVVDGTTSAKAVKTVTTTTPIVFTLTGD